MHTHTITKRVAESGAGMVEGWGGLGRGLEVLIEKASSLQEFAAEERRHNKVIKKNGLCDTLRFISGLSHAD